MTWQLTTFTLLALVLALGFAWYERTHPSSKVLAMVATLAALAALGRIAFAPLPNVKPTTDIVFLAGFVLGGAPGFAVGALGALSSNLVFGQGPWTPWQMVGWGAGRRDRRRLGGADARPAAADPDRGAARRVRAALRRADQPVHVDRGRRRRRRSASWLTVCAAGLPFDLAHAVGNVVFFLAFGPAFVRVLRRYRARLEVRWTPAPPTTVLPTLTDPPR